MTPRWESVALASVLVLRLAAPAVAQEEIFSLGMQVGTGARAVGMGGAYLSVGGDYSASFWNPATLADIHRNEIFGTFTHLQRQNSTGAFGIVADPVDHNAGFTKLNNFGMAYAVPTVRGSLVFSIGFNRLKSFDSNFAFHWFNPTEDDLVNQSWRERSRGSLNAWILAGAVDVSPNMSVGLGLNFWTGGSRFESAFREVDSDDLYTFERFTAENTLDNRINGFNLKLGSVIKFGHALRIGMTVATPVNLNVEEDWAIRDETVFDDAALSDNIVAGFFEYEIQAPWTIAAGASINLLNFVISGDVEYNDWTQVEFDTDPPIEGVTRNEANRLIADNYRATTRIRLGAEFTLPMTGLSFRAGYFRDPSILQNRDPAEDKQFVSAGMGLLIDKQVKLDFALVHGFWKRFSTDLPGTDDIPSYVEDIKTYQGFVTVGFRF